MAVRGDGSTATRIGIVDSPNVVGANISPNLLRFKIGEGVLTPAYLFNLLTTDGGQGLLGRHVTRTAKKTITARDIKRIQIPLPEYSLQENFARIAHRHKQLCTQQREAERQAEHLFGSLLGRAFRGEIQVFQFPKEPKKIRERIRRYERQLRKERERIGFIEDKSGTRYLLGPLYMILGDTEGAIRSFEWFETTFPDDIGEPFQYLCWTLALYRSGDLEAAARKLRQTMLSNLYLIPHLLGSDQEELDIWHASNWERVDYVQDAPPEIYGLWDEDGLQWVEETYHSPEFCQVRKRYIEIYKQLKVEPPGPKRSELVREAFRLQGMG